MKIIYSDKHKLHNPAFEIYDDKKEEYAEKPERIESIRQKLIDTGVGEFVSPREFSDELLTSVHHPVYVNFVKERSLNLQEGETLYPSYFITDTYIALVPGTYEAARDAANVVLTGAELILSVEQIVYALTRPPGHHAENTSMGGYCFFNNAAIAANYLSKQGRVAILDVDFHHGNGTQNIFYERDDVFYVSIHADPKHKYPYKSGYSDELGKGPGIGFNKNFPLPYGTTDAQYLPVLQKAISEIQKFNPDYLVVSLGFDTYEKDPICNFKLTIPFYEQMGREIKALDKPTLLVQEGGYTIDSLGEMAENFLNGILV